MNNLTFEEVNSLMDRVEEIDDKQDELRFKIYQLPVGSQQTTFILAKGRLLAKTKNSLIQLVNDSGWKVIPLRQATENDCFN